MTIVQLFPRPGPDDPYVVAIVANEMVQSSKNYLDLKLIQKFEVDKKYGSEGFNTIKNPIWIKVFQNRSTLDRKQHIYGPVLCHKILRLLTHTV